MNILFSPHSTRSASTSYAKNCLPLDSILKAEGRRSMKTFAQFYDKPIETRDSIFVYNVLKKRTQWSDNINTFYNVPRACLLNRPPVPAMGLKSNRSGL